MSPGPEGGRPALVHLVAGFGRFWWDFLVGDTPGITASVLVSVGVVALLRDAAHLNALAAVAIVVLSVATLLGSALRGRSSARKP